MSVFEKIKHIFTPFNALKKQRMIGDFCYYPIKLIAAVAISIFIYIYLTISWIYYTKGIKRIIDGIQDIIQVIAIRFNKNSL